MKDEGGTTEGGNREKVPRACALVLNLLVSE